MRRTCRNSTVTSPSRFPPAIDRVGCANGVSSCNSAQYRAFIGGNPLLEPEESTSYTAGVVWNATDDLAFEVTYYNTEFTNQIANITLQNQFNLEFDGSAEHGCP